MNVVIREATKDDLEQVKKLQQELVKIERPMDRSIPTEGIVEYYDLEKLIFSEEASVVVADDGELVGIGFVVK